MKLKKKLSDTVGSLVQIRLAAIPDQLVVSGSADPLVGSGFQWPVSSFGGFIMVSLEELDKEIAQIKERNLRVESDKAWETSKARKIIISIATYIIIGLFLTVAKIPDP